MYMFLTAATVVAVPVFLITRWVARATRRTGILPPRIAEAAHMRGHRVSLGGSSACSHYVVFSGKGDWGRGEIDPKNLVIFLHGMAAHSGHLVHGSDGGLARSLVDAGYTVLGLDLYGHGFSDAPDFAFAPSDFVAQLEALLRQLSITEPFHLIGFSHGSFISVAFAAQHPSSVKSLTLTSPFGCALPLHHWSCIAAFYALIVHLTFEENMSHVRSIFRLIMNMEGYRLRGFLDRIDAAAVNVFVVAGSWDCDPAMRILQTAKTIHQALGSSKLYVLPRGTHMTWATGSPSQQRDFRSNIVQFLQNSSGAMLHCAAAGPSSSVLGEATSNALELSLLDQKGNNRCKI